MTVSLWLAVTASLTQHVLMTLPPYVAQERKEREDDLGFRGEQERVGSFKAANLRPLQVHRHLQLLTMLPVLLNPIGLFLHLCMHIVCTLYAHCMRARSHVSTRTMQACSRKLGATVKTAAAELKPALPLLNSKMRSFPGMDELADSSR